MALETNGHVKRLRRFQPFHADAGELIYEMSEHRDRDFETIAKTSLLRLVEDDSVSLIILTGDAGHGKTTLCASLLGELGMPPAEVATAIAERGAGVEPIATTGGGRQLYVMKDLSDLDVSAGSVRLLAMLNIPEGSVAVVCANEGRLRAAVAVDDSNRLGVLTETLLTGIQQGTTGGVDGTVRILNLNYQSVAPSEHRGLVEEALHTWSADRRSWQICRRCDARAICPILANHEQLSDEADGSTRRSAIKRLFATAERAGAVITTRQALAAVAYAITGGLQCADVHKRWGRSGEDRTWQSPYLYHQALFGDMLTADQRRHVPSLLFLRRLDPGSVALRAVDDELGPAEADTAGFEPPRPALDEGTPRSRRDAQRESDTVRRLMRFLRRRDFFDAATSDDHWVRMGLRFGKDFEAAAEASSQAPVATAVRDRLLRGLEAVQGMHRPGEPPDFLVLDPAFTTARSRAALVAHRLNNRQVVIEGQEQRWRAISPAPELPDALDWLDRSVVVNFSQATPPVTIELDLRRFELLLRWAGGLSSRHEHEAIIRHLSSSLAQLVPALSDSDDITVLVGGERRTLSIDIGNRIRSGEG